MPRAEQASDGRLLEWMKVLVVPISIAMVGYFVNARATNQQVDSVYASLAVEIILSGAGEEDKSESQEAWESWAFQLLKETSPLPPTDELDELFREGDLEFLTPVYRPGSWPTLTCNWDSDGDGVLDEYRLSLSDGSLTMRCRQ